MARKPRTQNEGAINLDSLMDALTNVVAVMILVLVLVQADVSQKVQKFIDDLLPATPEEIAASKEVVASLAKRKETLVSAMRAEAPSPERIEEEKRQLALLEKSLEQSTAKLADLGKLREIEKKVRAERDSESKVTNVIQDEIAKLETLLDDTPVLKTDEPTVVNIPNSRPIPEKAKIYHAIASKGRIHIIDPHTPLELFKKEFEKNKGDWLQQRVKVKGAADRYFYNGQKIQAFLSNYDWKNTRGQKVVIEAPPTAWKLQLVITPDLEKSGTPTADLATPGSAYSQAAALIKRDFNAVLLFRVAPDSFDTYLKARELADRANIASGWDIHTNPQYFQRIEEPTIKPLKDPPPPDPKKPKPVGPPPLDPKLD